MLVRTPNISQSDVVVTGWTPGQDVPSRVPHMSQNKNSESSPTTKKQHSENKEESVCTDVHLRWNLNLQQAEQLSTAHANPVHTDTSSSWAAASAFCFVIFAHFFQISPVEELPSEPSDWKVYPPFPVQYKQRLRAGGCHSHINSNVGIVVCMFFYGQSCSYLRNNRTFFG